MTNNRFFLFILAILLACPASILKAVSQTPDYLYVTGRDYSKPFPVGSVSHIRFNDTTTLVGARRFYNTDIDSITFQKPASAFLDDLGSAEAVATPIMGASILDITARTGEDETRDRNVYSAWYMLTVAGMPFFTTTDLNQALSGSRMTVISSPIDSATFTNEEIQQITQWVNGGGVLVLSSTTTGSNIALNNLVGYSKPRDFARSMEVTWNTALADKPEFDYIDTDEERTVIVGRNTFSDTTSYRFDDIMEGIDTLATANFGSWVVAVRHTIGSGRVYSYSCSWGRLIQQPHFFKDGYRRTGNNHFEPSADAVPFQLRSIYCHQSQQPAVWKFTIPDGYESLLIPTHDCDSRTALDSMYFMSQYEKSLGASCHYFITTHYFREPQTDGNIRQGFSYTQDRVPKVRQLILDGHTVGSHSIGHFPDFDHAERFPMTVYNDTSEYHPMYDNETKATTGGSTWAEINLSKWILQHDLDNNLQSFRTGHLCMNDSIPRSMQMAGINFASCYTAHDVRSEFPFQERLGNVPEGDFDGVLEMPLHFSDVFNSRNDTSMNASNWRSKVEIWKGIHPKLAANYAPAIILIHPNREWKMEAEKMLVDTYDHDKIGIYNFEAYGNFWKTRMNTNFSYGYDADKNLVTIHLENALSDYGLLPFAIEGLSANALPTVHLTDPDNKVVAVGQLKPTAVTGRYICLF